LSFKALISQDDHILGDYNGDCVKIHSSAAPEYKSTGSIFDF